MRLYVESIKESRAAATAIAEYLGAEAARLRHNRNACGCSTCTASREANALLTTVCKLDEQKRD